MSAKRIETNKCKLIMLRGNSGSGKTTLAHMLQHKLGRGTLVISQDVIRRDMLWARDTKDGPAVPLLSMGGGTVNMSFWKVSCFLKPTRRCSDASSRSTPPRTFTPIIMTSPLRKRCAAMRRSPTGLILVRRPCGIGGRRRILSGIFRRQSLHRI